MPQRIVILSQVYVPDPASVGQHLHDLAAEFARRGHDVIVYCSSRGYDDPSQRYARSEVRDGVKIYRYSLPLFSKTSMPRRVFGSAWAMASLFLNTLFTRRVSCVFYSTSPPLVGLLATIAAKIKGALRFRRVPRAYWAMDLNPDQLLAMGKLKPGSLTHRILEGVNRIILKNADLIVPLDRFMADRLENRPGGKLDLSGKFLVMPPWPHEKPETPLPHDQNWFREKHGMGNSPAEGGKFVVMYSGNHSPANPLDTLLEATLRLRDDPSILFAFIGGGMGKKQVNEHIEKHGLKNCLSLPYQPMKHLRYSLSAADVHVVSLGEDMVGIIHPCKVYGSMAVGRPILFLGPRPSHVSDILDAHQIGLHVSHGDVEGCVRAIRTLRDSSREQLGQMGARAQTVLRNSLSQEILCTKLADGVESILR